MVSVNEIFREIGDMDMVYEQGEMMGRLKLGEKGSFSYLKVTSF